MRSIQDVKSSLHVTSMPLLLSDTRVASPLAKRIVPLLHVARFLRARYSISGARVSVNARSSGFLINAISSLT